MAPLWCVLPHSYTHTDSIKAVQLKSKMSCCWYFALVDSPASSADADKCANYVRGLCVRRKHFPVSVGAIRELYWCFTPLAAAELPVQCLLHSV